MFFNLSLNFAIRVHDLSHSQLLVLFLLMVWSFSSFGYKEYNPSDFGVDHLVMSMCRVFSCVVGKRVFTMTSAFSWQNSVSLCPASFCTPRPNLPVTLGISWLPTFAFQSLIMKGTSFWGVSSRRSCRFSKLFNFSFFNIAGWGIDSDYCDIEWFALEMNRDHSVVFEIASKYCISDSVDYVGYSISSRGGLPTVVLLNCGVGEDS